MQYDGPDAIQRQPEWARRPEATLAKCRWAIDFITRWSDSDTPAVTMWRRRLAATAELTG